MIIGISGKIGSGKDTVGKIIQYLVDGHQISFNDYLEDCKLPNNYSKPFFDIKKFADYLKDIVCGLINCTREQLEDPVFKDTELGKEWNIDYDDVYFGKYIYHKLTPRLLLQLLGTECGRNIIHPNIWVNALMSKYERLDIPTDEKESVSIGEETVHIIYKSQPLYPNWIITDVRFPNELQAIKDKKGISIRVSKGVMSSQDVRNQHESETALDEYGMDYFIANNGTIEELIEKVKEILIKEQIIC